MARKPRKRVNGEGSVYKRKDGRWVGQYVEETPEGPKYRYVYAKTQAGALQKRNEAMAKRGSGLAFDAGRTTVGEFLDRWIEDSVRDNVAPRTLDNYRLHVRRYIKPLLGNKKLAKVDAVHIQALLRSKLDEGLSPATVRYTYAVLRRALKQAKRWRLVDHNAAEDVDPPRLVKRETKVLSPKQVRALLKAARGDRFEALYVLAVTVGLRQGELLGLSWDDVDLDTGRLRIHRQLQRLRDGSGLKFVTPKSGKGRTVQLVPSAIKALRSHRRRQAEEKLRAGSLYPDHNLVFVTTIGTPLDAQNIVNRSFKPLLRDAGLPSIRFHDLRHTCATLLLAKCVPHKFVQALLGHASIGITMDLYSHWAPAMGDWAATAMEDTLQEEDQTETESEDLPTEG